MVDKHDESRASDGVAFTAEDEFFEHVRSVADGILESFDDPSEFDANEEALTELATISFRVSKDVRQILPSVTVYYYLFKFGMLVERLANRHSYLDGKQRKEYRELRLEKHIREEPLKLKQLGQAKLAKWYKDIAVKIWARDLGEELRVAEVAERVNDEVFALLHYLIKDDDGSDSEELEVFLELTNLHLNHSSVASIKTHIRGVAPPYAKKGGRPKKN